MIRRTQYLLPVVVGFLGVATVWADVGYLPQAGPLPMRFRVPPPPPSLAPAIAPVVLPPPEPVPLPLPPKPPEPTNAPLLKPVVTNAPALEYDARDHEPILSPGTGADSVVVPQMLIKYFTKSTNGPATGVIAPLGFTPPAVTAPAPAPAPPTPANPAPPPTPP